MCRGDLRSPAFVLPLKFSLATTLDLLLVRQPKKLSHHTCRGRRPRRPTRRNNAVTVISLMPNYIRVTLSRYSPIIQRSRNNGTPISVKQKLRRSPTILNITLLRTHGRPQVAPTSYSGNFLPPQNRSARCCLLLHACAQLWSAMPIPHFSLLTPHLTTSPT